MTPRILAINELEPIFKQIDNLGEGVVILEGDLATGKTTLVKEYIAYKGCEAEVSSPTFSIQNCYCDRFFHYDIYNHGLEHFLSLGLLEEFEKSGIHLVEWGNDELFELTKSIGIEVMSIKISKMANNQHQYEIIHA